MVTGRNETLGRRIRLGMVGGGNDAFIGGVHRIAARIDDKYELVAGALSSTPEKSRASGEALGLPRIYNDYKTMAIREARRKDGIEAVAIVTPNHVHYAAAREFLKRGIHVICDKPLTSTLADAKKLVKAAEASDALFILTHNYTGYPMVRRAREIVASGGIGKVRVVQVEYPQDWLTEPQDFKQAAWRTDPARSGAGGSTGDIGTHAYNLACFITGLEAESLAADLQFLDALGADFDRAGSLTTTGMCCCVSMAVRGGCFGVRRWPPATRTRCASASMGRQAGWNGRRRTRTTCGSPRSESRSA